MSSSDARRAADELARASEALREIDAVVGLDDISKRHRPRKLSPHSNTTVRAHIPRSMAIDGGMEASGNYQPLVYTGGSPLIVDEPCVIIREFPGSESNE